MKNIVKLCIITTPLLCNSLYAAQFNSDLNAATRQRFAEMDRQMQQQAAQARQQVNDAAAVNYYINQGLPVPSQAMTNNTFAIANAHNQRLAQQKK